MPLLLDETFGRQVTQALRDAGHDVLTVRSFMPGQPDSHILMTDAARGRILVSADRDFGDLLYRDQMPAPDGVVLVRLWQFKAPAIARRLVEALDEPRTWLGQFSVVLPDRVRQALLPVAGSADPASPT